MNYQPVQEPDSVKRWLVVLKFIVACRAVLVSQQQEKFRCARIWFPGENRLNFQRLCPHVNDPDPYVENKTHPVDSFGPCTGIMKL